MSDTVHPFPFRPALCAIALVAALATIGLHFWPGEQKETVAAAAVAVALAGAAVTGAGILGFVGLLAPHVARLLVGAKHARLLPISMLLGALLVLAALLAAGCASYSEPAAGEAASASSSGGALLVAGRATTGMGRTRCDSGGLYTTFPWSKSDPLGCRTSS